eukprot:6488481-Amphidinium_carterae.2
MRHAYPTGSPTQWTSGGGVGRGRLHWNRCKSVPKASECSTDQTLHSSSGGGIHRVSGKGRAAERMASCACWSAALGAGATEQQDRRGCVWPRPGHAVPHGGHLGGGP